MFFLTSKFHDNRFNTFGFMGGGGGLLKLPPPHTQAQELQKSPGGIGLVERTKEALYTYQISCQSDVPVLCGK